MATALMAPSRVRRLSMVFLPDAKMDVQGIGITPCWRGTRVEDRRLKFAAPQYVGIDGQDDDGAGHHRLPFLGHRKDAQAIGQHGNDEGADQRAEYGAAPARKRGAPD